MIPDQTREDWERRLADLNLQRAMFESGKMGAGEKALGSTTEQSLSHVIQEIADLEALMNEHPPMK